MPDNVVTGWPPHHTHTEFAFKIDFKAELDLRPVFLLRHTILLGHVRHSTRSLFNLSIVQLNLYLFLIISRPGRSKHGLEMSCQQSTMKH